MLSFKHRPQSPKVLLLAAMLSIQAQLPATAATDTTNKVKDLNTPRDFPPIASRAEWQARAKEIREHVLVSCGLWPMPERPPIQAHIFGKIERDGYSVEKVYFQTVPGFYLAGNLYRPLGRGTGPFPGVLNPHGHWPAGRFADTKDGSIAARCINFARQGMIAFSYDMVGYNDTHFADTSTNKSLYDAHRTFGAGHVDQLWNISLMGLQTWDSIRALDFLESLPDVDRKRLACTGESGGGTQTFMLGAVEDRLAAQAPVVMVSHTMQGGCSCENAPGLRVEYSNMEIAATPAPRPQILVAATGDWTRATLTVEGPAIAHIYELFKARDKFDFVRFDFGHNYNRTSREAVYGWFGKWLVPNLDPALLKESTCQKEPDDDLRVFPGGKLPDDAMTREQFTESLKQRHLAQWQALVPTSKAGLAKFKEVMQVAWRHNLQLKWPVSPPMSRKAGPRKVGGFERMILSDTADGDLGIVVLEWHPANYKRMSKPTLVVVAQPDDSNYPAYDAPPAGVTLKVLEQGVPVWQVVRFSMQATNDQFANFYTTYNRTRLQSNVRDLLGVCEGGKAAAGHAKVILVGSGAAGFSALMAAPGADAVVADLNGVDFNDDQVLLDADHFAPGLRSMGTCEGAAMLAAPHPLVLHNTGANFATPGISAAYKAAKADKAFTSQSGRLSDEAVVKWITEL